MENTESDDIIQEILLSKKEESDHWPLFLQKLQEDAPARLEYTTKFFLGIVSLTLAILTRSISTDDLQKWIFVLVFTLWLLSVIFSLFVLVPYRLKIFSNSAESIKRAIYSTARRKTRLLILNLC